MNPSPETYDNAVRILARNKQPIRAADLYRLAFVLTVGHPEPGYKREDERFRERLTERRPDVIKRGPWFALRRWVDPVLPSCVTPSDFVTLPLTFAHTLSAAWETWKRLPYMVKRNPHVREDTRFFAALQGFLVQHHVQDYFQLHWPTSYHVGSNEDDYERPAPDDFSLSLNGKRWKIDVAGAKQATPPQFTLRPDKMRGADLHIIAYPDHHGIYILGYHWPTDPDGRLWPIERLFVRLNIQQLGPTCCEHFEDVLP